MIIAVSPELERRGPGDRQSLERVVRQNLERGESVVSASGTTAALAINYCERIGLSYSVESSVMDGVRRYHVRRLP